MGATMRGAPRATVLLGAGVALGSGIGWMVGTFGPSGAGTGDGRSDVPVEGGDRECGELRAKLAAAEARAIQSEALALSWQQAAQESTEKVESAAKWQELSLLGPSVSWDDAEPRSHPDQVRKRIDELNESCGGGVGLVELDCFEYPCISWQVPTSKGCRIRGGSLTGVVGASGKLETEGIAFVVHGSTDLVRSRVDWRLSQKRQELEEYDPEVLPASGGGKTP